MTRQHKLEVTSERLDDHYVEFANRLTDEELMAIVIVTSAFDRIVGKIRGYADAVH